MAGIKCCICKKKQSGWIKDYELIDDNYKICAECQEHLEAIMKSDKEIAKKEVEYFKNYTNKLNSNNIVREYLEEMYRLIDSDDIESIDIKLKKIYQNEDKKEEIRKKRALKSIVLTTGNNIEGYIIVKYVDVIFCEKIITLELSRDLKTIENTVSSIQKEEMDILSKRIYELKNELKKELKLQSVEIDANAIIGINYETTILGDKAIMGSITGTATVVKKINYYN